MLDEARAAGFFALDVWVAHLHPLWATPGHVAVFLRLCEERRLRRTSLAGGFGATRAEFRASCRMAAALGRPVLGGMTPLLVSDRAAMTAILREHGLIFALENHPEKSPAELLAKLGAGDEDVIKAAADTGWFATHGYPADSALRELGGRLGLVHLKDIRAAGAHDTCPLGEGVVPVRECLLALKETGCRGTISIEHEPFDSDPVPGCAAGRKLAAAVLASREGFHIEAEPVGMAILGCGNIAGAYAGQLAAYPEARLLGVCDTDAARAREFGARHSLPVYDDLDALLADHRVKVVVNLTIHHAHFETTKRCLEAGKHVHTEKPLATRADEAWELVRLAEERGLRLSSAPTTWLGEAQQTAWAWIEAGLIGTPRVVYAEVNWGRIEGWHPNPAPFYAVGPVFDVAVCPVTLLTAWFGPVRRVTAGGGIVYPHRKTPSAAPFEVTSPDWARAVLELDRGPLVRLTPSFYVSAANSQSGMELHGDRGSLRLSRWDCSDAVIEHGEFGKPMRRLPLAQPPFFGIEYARGARDLAQAIREGRPHRCAGAQAAHVVEVCEAVLMSLREGRAVEISSGFDLPEPLPWARQLANARRDV